MNNWEKSIKRRLGSAEAPLPEGDWAMFQQALAANRGQAAGKVFPWYWIAVPAAALAVLLAAVLMPRRPAAPAEPIVASATMPEGQTSSLAEGNGTPVEIETAPLPTPDPEPATAPAPVRRAVPETSPTAEETALAEVVDMTPETASDPSNDADPTSTPDNATTPSSAPQTPAVVPLASAPATSVPLVRMPRTPFKHGIWTGSALALAGAASGVVLSQPVRQTPITESIMANDPIPGYAMWSIDPADPLTTTTTTTHYMPSNLGVGLRVPLGTRVSFVTGVEYSHCYTSISSTGKKDNSSQVAHFLGMPFRMDWSLVRIGCWDLYAGGGFEIDLYLGGRHSNSYFSPHSLIFSTQLTTGVEYHLTPLIGFYIEPRLNWYPAPRDYILVNHVRITDQHALRTYRTVRPLNFDVGAGVRFTIPVKH